MEIAAKKFQLVNSNTPFPQLASGWQQTRHAYGMDLSRNRIFTLGLKRCELTSHLLLFYRAAD